jgi:prophage DNA circulation protein
MAWQDELQPASFRDVPFEVDVADKQGGRRVVVHEYPLGNEVEIEDLGDGAHRFSIEAFVLGDDYITRRDRLEAALDQAGPGVLVHPTRGRIDVVAEAYSTEDVRRGAGRCARIRIQFVRAPSVTRPTGVVDTQDATRASAALVDAAAAAQFEENFEPGSDEDRVWSLAVLTDSLTPVAQAVRAVQAGMSAAQLQLVRALLDPIAGARSTLSGLIGLPGDLAGRVQSLVGNVGNASDLRTLFDRPSRVRSPRGRPADNQAAIDNLLRTAIATQQARLTAQTDFASYDQATSELERVLESLELVTHAADDTTFTALQDLTAAVARDLSTRATNLARITHHTPAETLPALVVAHRLYGAAGVEARAAEICERNAVTDPGFLTGGVTLEVLTP